MRPQPGLTYGSYLALPEVLAAQRPQTAAHDELLFIVVHQVYELWFRQLLHELEAVRAALAADDTATALHLLRRVRTVDRLLVEQVDVLETMSPQDFLAFRSELAPASGFQSVQFREVEFLSGLKDPGYLERVRLTADERERLQRRLSEPTVNDEFLALLGRRGVGAPEELLTRRADHPDLFEVGEALLDHDAAFASWRARHVRMVERMVGSKPGTGGSAGAAYLRTTLDKRFFPELWRSRDVLA